MMNEIIYIKQEKWDILTDRQKEGLYFLGHYFYVLPVVSDKEGFVKFERVTLKNKRVSNGTTE